MRIYKLSSFFRPAAGARVLRIVKSFPKQTARLSVTQADASGPSPENAVTSSAPGAALDQSHQTAWWVCLYKAWRWLKIKSNFCLSHFNFSVKNHEQKSVLAGITHLDWCSGHSLMFPSISILAQSGFDFDNLIEIPRITVQGETLGSFTFLYHWIRGGLIILFALYSRDPNKTNDAIVSPASRNVPPDTILASDWLMSQSAAFWLANANDLTAATFSLNAVFLQWTVFFQACKNFYDDGVCKQECPPMHIYNPVSYRWERDPKGKYAYGATCVKECPEHLLKDNGACVRSCPEKFRVS